MALGLGRIGIPFRTRVGQGTPAAPVNTVAPVASGNQWLGQLLSCTDGTWTGNPSPTFTYQWQRNGVDIALATNSTYTVVSADMGTTVRCVVTASNGVGAPVAANSNGLAIMITPMDLVAATNEYGWSTARILRGAYTGALVRIRRSSDDTEQDIYPMETGWIDTDAITIFVGSSDYFSVAVYDQGTAANPLRQNTANLQPQMGIAGVANVINTRQSAVPNGSTRFLNINTGINSVAHTYAFSVMRRTAAATRSMMIGTTSTSRYTSWWDTDNRTYSGFGTPENDHAGASAATGNFIVTSYNNGTTTFQRRNAVQVGNNVASTPSGAFNTLMRVGTMYSSAPWCETVLFTGTDISASVATIESQINASYGIY